MNTISPDESRLPRGADWPPGQARPQGETDPELLALPAPPRGRRFLSIALLLSVIAGSLALLAQLRSDAAYALAAGSATDIGDATVAPLAELVPNRYVRVHGTPMLSRAVRYEHTLSGSAYAIFPLAGQRQVFVQVPLQALSDPGRVARGEFAGRLVTFGQLGPRMRAIRGYLAGALSMPVTAESFVVMAEETPAAYGWALFASAGCLAMMLVGAWLLWRCFLPLRASAD